MHDYFVQYGEVIDVVVMAAGTGKTRRSRGFGFVTFASPESVEAVGQKRYHWIGDRSVEVKRAVSREAMQQATPNSTLADVEKVVDTWQAPVAAVGLPAESVASWPTSPYYDQNSGYMYPGGWMARPQPYGNASLGMVPHVPAGVPIYFGQAAPTYVPIAPSAHSPTMHAMPVMGAYIM